MGNGFRELMGQGVNGVTGDYSRRGYWVKMAILHTRWQSLRCGNLKDMLLNIVALADDIDLRSSIRAPSNC